MSDRTFYKLDPNGSTLAAIADYIKKQNDTWDEWVRFCESVKASNIYSSDWVLGVELENPDLEVWQNTKKLPSGFYKPRRLKGSELHQWFSSLPGKPSLMRFSQIIDVDCPSEGNKIFFASFETIGDDHFLSLHNAVQRVPSDATALKMSEYYAIKEAHE